MAGDGSASGFDETSFRDSIHFAMQMGLPDDVSQRVTFRFDETLTFANADPAGHPYSWSEAPSTDVVTRDVQVPAAVQWGLGLLADDTMGQFDTSKVVLTLLDVDYAQVKGCNEVLINGQHYVIDAVGPPLGLFTVTVYQMFLRGRG